jgi:hypothetical protein
MESRVGRGEEGERKLVRIVKKEKEVGREG